MITCLIASKLFVIIENKTVNILNKINVCKIIMKGRKISKPKQLQKHKSG